MSRNWDLDQIWGQSFVGMGQVEAAEFRPVEPEPPQAPEQPHRIWSMSHGRKTTSTHIALAFGVLTGVFQTVTLPRFAECIPAVLATVKSRPA